MLRLEPQVAKAGVLRLDVRCVVLRVRTVGIRLSVGLPGRGVGPRTRSHVACAGWGPRSQLDFAFANFLDEVRNEQRTHERKCKQNPKANLESSHVASAAHY